MALDQATLAAVRSTRELVEAWSEAARKAALEARKRHGHAGIVGIVKSGEHPPTRIANVLDARDVRKTIEHIQKHEDQKDPKVRKLHAALKNRMAPAPATMPDMQTHLANVVADYRKKRHPLYDGSTRHGGPKLKISTSRKALAHAAIEEVLGANWRALREASFEELKHPRSHGKFASKGGPSHPGLPKTIGALHGLIAAHLDEGADAEADAGFHENEGPLRRAADHFAGGKRASVDDLGHAANHLDRMGDGAESDHMANHFYELAHHVQKQIDIAKRTEVRPDGTRVVRAKRRVQEGFAEQLHPRDRRGKFRDSLHVPTSKDHIRRPLRSGEFPLGNNLPEPRSGITPERVNNRRGRIARALADSDLSHGGVAHPGLASPGVRTHYDAEGDMGRKRNVKAMGDKKLRHLLTHPQTHPDLRERVRAEIVSRGGEAGAIASAPSRSAPRRRTPVPPPSPPSPSPSLDDLASRLPGGGTDSFAHTSDNDSEAVRHWRRRVGDRGVVEPMEPNDVHRAFNGARHEQKLYYRTTALPYGDMRDRGYVQDAIEAIGEYNDFDPEIVIDRLDEHADDIAEVAIAREGSAALYLRPSNKGAAGRLVKAFDRSDDRRRSGADEATVEPTGWVRLWWD